MVVLHSKSLFNIHKNNIKYRYIFINHGPQHFSFGMATVLFILLCIFLSLSKSIQFISLIVFKLVRVSLTLLINKFSITKYIHIWIDLNKFSCTGWLKLIQIPSFAHIKVFIIKAFRSSFFFFFFFYNFIVLKPTIRDGNEGLGWTSSPRHLFYWMKICLIPSSYL